jgi:Transglycosylase SLT domain
VPLRCWFSLKSKVQLPHEHAFMRMPRHTPTLTALLTAGCLLAAPGAHATEVVTIMPPVGAGMVDPPLPMPMPARARLLPLIQAEAAKLNLPSALADAVAVVESGYTETALGTSGEIGLMQVMPSTAGLLGFRGSLTDLYKAETNIHYGVTYLAQAWQASGGNACRALMKYRAGVGEEGFSPLSIQYCQRAGAWLRSQDPKLAENVATNTPASATLDDPHVISMAGRRPTRIDAITLADITGTPDLVVERMPVAAWHVSRGGRIRPDIRAVIEAAGGDSDPHVIQVPSAAP